MATRFKRDHKSSGARVVCVDGFYFVETTAFSHPERVADAEREAYRLNNPFASAVAAISKKA